MRNLISSYLPNWKKSETIFMRWYRTGSWISGIGWLWLWHPLMTCSPVLPVPCSMKWTICWKNIRSRHLRKSNETVCKALWNDRKPPSGDACHDASPAPTGSVRPQWTEFLHKQEHRLYGELSPETYGEVCREFDGYMKEREYEYEQLLMYFLFTYFCGAVYDEKCLW